jgi:hypothetical protein
MNYDQPASDIECSIRLLAPTNEPVRLFYQGRPEGLDALARELEAEGIRAHFTLPTGNAGASLFAEIMICVDDGIEESSGALKEAVMWAIINFQYGRPWVVATVEH